MLYSRGKICIILFSTSAYQNINVLKHFNDSFYFYILMLLKDNIVYLKQSYIYELFKYLDISRHHTFIIRPSSSDYYIYIIYIFFVKYY